MKLISSISCGLHFHNLIKERKEVVESLSLGVGEAEKRLRLVTSVSSRTAFLDLRKGTNVMIGSVSAGRAEEMTDVAVRVVRHR